MTGIGTRAGAEKQGTPSCAAVMLAHAATRSASPPAQSPIAYPASEGRSASSSGVDDVLSAVHDCDVDEKWMHHSAQRKSTADKT